MTPAARAQAAITVLDQILSGEPAEAALLRWSRASRFAGSGDRAAVRDLVFDALRCRDSRAALGGALSGRGLILGMCREEGLDPALIFSGSGHGPDPLADSELTGGRQPDDDEALDLPGWLLPSWRMALGEQAGPIARAMRERAPVWLRINTRLADTASTQRCLAEEGIEAEPSRDLPSALCVRAGARRIASSRAYLEGMVELQDLSPQLACAELPQAATVLDFCAGGGGKSLALAARGGAKIIAHDANHDRMRDLPARAKRARARIEIAKPGQVLGDFDLVLADVPCSGSGTWRRTPDAKWRLTAQGFQDLLGLQARIMSEAAGHVAAGGHLAYMTCSLLREENQDQVAAFLAQAAFEPVMQQIFTPLDASDGFFVAVMRRR
ncbi:RsmB/NOP family class I SAM-dependent RNA methyltransferase [Paracoccus ravus]|uniref:RsmB/NOP family class I SAM-dependent RNA methyltransferase n=1 Tax=Paracoccus ravus TaxID=2447760 RepID=UPI00106E641C|nr:RsmB/NOP family class I SAM-dependent RNA methyltransferase [Paracoccus ravus]